MKNNDKKVYYGRQKISINEKRKNIENIFSEVSTNYDKMNDIMSLGTHRIWKKDLVSRVSYNFSRSKTYKILDIAGGTGDIALSILKKYPNNEITILDLTPCMIQMGKNKALKEGVNNIIWVSGDSANLPFKKSYYDIITCAFGIRNVAEIEKSLGNALYTLKPGGKIYILEFSPKIVPSLQKLYEYYLNNIIPALGEKFANNRNAYQYLIESIETFYSPIKFKEIMFQIGFKHVKVKKYMGGVACLYIAAKI